MNEELKTAFSALDIKTKKKQIYEELLAITNLIIKEEDKFNILDNVDLIDKFNENFTEDEFLNSIYINIYNIHQELITLIDAYKIIK